MKCNHPSTVLWDEIDDVSREDSQLQFPWEVTSQGIVKALGDDQIVTTLWSVTLFTGLSEEVALLVLLLLFSMN
jgi:hypothetical protein